MILDSQKQKPSQKPNDKPAKGAKTTIMEEKKPKPKQEDVYDPKGPAPLSTSYRPPVKHEEINVVEEIVYEKVDPKSVPYTSPYQPYSPAQAPVQYYKQNEDMIYSQRPVMPAAMQQPMQPFVQNNYYVQPIPDPVPPPKRYSNNGYLNQTSQSAYNQEAILNKRLSTQKVADNSKLPPMAPKKYSNLPNDHMKDDFSNPLHENVLNQRLNPEYQPSFDSEEHLPVDTRINLPEPPKPFDDLLAQNRKSFQNEYTAIEVRDQYDSTPKESFINWDPSFDRKFTTEPEPMTVRKKISIESVEYQISAEDYAKIQFPRRNTDTKDSLRKKNSSTLTYFTTEPTMHSGVSSGVSSILRQFNVDGTPIEPLYPTETKSTGLGSLLQKYEGDEGDMKKTKLSLGPIVQSDFISDTEQSGVVDESGLVESTLKAEPVESQVLDKVEVEYEQSQLLDKVEVEYEQSQLLDKVEVENEEQLVTNLQPETLETELQQPEQVEAEVKQQDNVDSDLNQQEEQPTSDQETQFNGQENQFGTMKSVFGSLLRKYETEPLELEDQPDVVESSDVQNPTAESKASEAFKVEEKPVEPVEATEKMPSSVASSAVDQTAENELLQRESIGKVDLQRETTVDSLMRHYGQ